MGDKNDIVVDFKTVKRKTLSKQVIDEIVSLLSTGQLKPGDRLPSELELMEILKVSRPVMREALTSLEAMGIVNRETKNGTFFSNKIGSKPFSLMLALSSGDLRAILETRISLELGLVTLAAEKITEENLEKLLNTITVMESNTEYREADKEFHKIIAYSASNSLLEGIIDPLLTMYDATLDQISTGLKDPEQTLKQHKEIYEALKKHDPMEAYMSMYRHLSSVRERALKSIEEK
ncbi:DNA-binding FadR family transcriptional regulator [Bacillus mesophilus]|uniref:FadR family transcriptional regulator n=1 Tax=Bacillus mesophilus TaxID=1808955 RepID=A0A6M0QBT6_9BACI|nr:DNA-binding FadR family transcriptional regulator [Bacillus mesophilus]NEY73813.1 FadR family transcriptional regulator [Bacillus mesophilus]